METYNDDLEKRSVVSDEHSPISGASEELGQDQTSLHTRSDDVEGPIEAAPLSRLATSIRTTGTTDPRFEVDWDGEDDPSNPRNWPLWYRAVIVVFLSFSTWVVYVTLSG